MNLSEAREATSVARPFMCRCNRTNWSAPAISSVTGSPSAPRCRPAAGFASWARITPPPLTRCDERPHHRHEVSSRIASSRMRAMPDCASGDWPRDQVDQFVVELGHIHEFRPGAMSGRARMRQRNGASPPRLPRAVGPRRAHLRPAQAEPMRIASSIPRRGGASSYQQQRLAPDRLEGAVGDMGVDPLGTVRGNMPMPRRMSGGFRAVWSGAPTTPPAAAGRPG